MDLLLPLVKLVTHLLLEILFFFGNELFKLELVVVYLVQQLFDVMSVLKSIQLVGKDILEIVEAHLVVAKSGL